MELSGCPGVAKHESRNELGDVTMHWLTALVLLAAPIQPQVSEAPAVDQKRRLEVAERE
jgi:hypothetical protein